MRQEACARVGPGHWCRSSTSSSLQTQLLSAASSKEPGSQPAQVCKQPCSTSIPPCLILVAQVVPILRAGLVLLEQAGTVLPVSETYHVGYVRDEETLQVGRRRRCIKQRLLLRWRARGVVAAGRVCAAAWQAKGAAAAVCHGAEWLSTVELLNFCMPWQQASFCAGLGVLHA